MAKEAVGISEGMVLSVLYKKLDSLEKNENIRIVKDNVRRKFLPIRLAIQSIIDAETTLHELICEAYPEAELNERDTQFLDDIQQLSDNKLTALLDTIRNTQDPWWLTVNSESGDKAPQRVREVTVRRAGTYKRLDPERYPVVTSFDTLRFLCIIQTDRLHELSNELDAPYSAFTNLGFSIPYYTQNKLADQVFCEYKFLTSSLRDIPEAFVTATISQEGEC